ncbi:MAG: hypothetical protein AAGL97_15615 [Pseudomonadota bacterium]
MSDRLEFVNLDLATSSRSLATNILELAWMFEDLYVPDDPNALINQALHDEVTEALHAAYAQLINYVLRVQEATEASH